MVCDRLREVPAVPQMHFYNIPSQKLMKERIKTKIGDEIKCDKREGRSLGCLKGFGNEIGIHTANRQPCSIA